MAEERAVNDSGSLRYGLEELKFLRSIKDAGIFGEKVAYKLRQRSDFARGTAPSVPPSVQIEPTNVCNLRCTTCPGSRSACARGFMEMDLFEKIATEAAGLGVKRIHLYLRGEPLLHPKITEMIAFIKAHGMAVHFATNATKMTPELSTAMLLAGMDSADQLTVSFLGHSKASHEATMVGVDHDQVVDNVLGLVRLRRELHVNGPVVEVIFNAPPENQHESGAFLEFWRGKVDHARLGEISVEFENYKRDDLGGIKRTIPCNAILERMPILWNGKVPQCNGDFDGDWELGDMRTDSIVDVWNCERLREVRRVHRERTFSDIPMCLHCDL